MKSYIGLFQLIRIHPHGRVLIMSSGHFVGKTNFCLVGFKIGLIICLRGNFNKKLHVGGGGVWEVGLLV